jgi:hypothetical protein
MEPLQTPILFLIFNRPDTTQRVFDAIRKAQPRQLFVAADGARKNKEGEAQKCAATRDIIRQVDWECEVKTLFREENLGCGRAVSSAITWFFDNVEEGIILEDDCLPHPSFFPYCENLLERYRDNEKVMVISGDNFNTTQHNTTQHNTTASYYFSAFNFIWGWATWRTAWNKYIFDAQKIPVKSFAKSIRRYFRHSSIRWYWWMIFYQMRQHKIDTWDYPWTFSIWINRGLSIVPYTNMISNIGFGADATHTTAAENNKANLPAFDIGALVHPSEIKQCKEADEYFCKREGIMVSTLKLCVRIVRFVGSVAFSKMKQ